MKSKFDRVIFVSPNSVVGRNFSDGCWIPRGVWSVMSFVRRQFPDIGLNLVDGNLLGYEEMERQVLELLDSGRGRDLVALSVHTTFAYPNALRLLKKVQGRVAVVVGGFHATCLPGEIVTRRSLPVIVGCGEESLAAFLSQPSELVPGLWWPDQGMVHRNPSGQQMLPWDIKLDFNLIDRRPYVERFRSRAPQNVRDRISGYLIFTHQGCRWRDSNPRSGEGHGGCTFCCLPQSYLLPQPQVIWAEMERVIKQWGAPVYFKDYGDCFSGSWDYARRFLAARPAHMRPGEHYFLEVYLKPGEVTRTEDLRVLTDLGVHRVFVGFETAHHRVMKIMRKGSTPKLHRLCAELIFEAGLELNASFILGGATEDTESVEETVRFAEWLKVRGGDRLVCTGASPLAIMPGSPIYSQLLDHRPEFKGVDDPDTDELRLAWIEHFCGTLAPTPADALDYLKKRAEYITSLGQVKNYVGWEPA